MECVLLMHSQVQEEEALQLVDSMLEYDALSQLLYRLRHFNEAVPEEAEAVQKLLSVFENMIEVKPDVAEQLVQLGDAKTGFLRYSSLLQRTCQELRHLPDVETPDASPQAFLSFVHSPTHMPFCPKTAYLCILKSQV